MTLILANNVAARKLATSDMRGDANDGGISDSIMFEQYCLELRSRNLKASNFDEFLFAVEDVS
jgi:hypothetical protein